MTKIGPAAAPKNLSNRRDYACKTGENRYIGGQGVPAQCCRRAFARFKENMAVTTLFLLDVLRDLSERRRGQARDFFGRQGLPGGFRKSVLSKTAGADSRLNANCLHRRGRPFWGRAPRDRFEPREPGAASVRAWGAGSHQCRPAGVC